MNASSALQETLPPLDDGVPPRDLEAAWAGFDPQAEPLDTATAAQIKAKQQDHQRLNSSSL